MSLLGFFHLSHNPSANRRPENRTPRCGLCNLNHGCKTPAMRPTGDGQRRILMVAEAPGAEEDERGIQLIGKAGQHLRQHLSNLDIDLDQDCWKTNAVTCRPPQNRKPTPEEIEGCRPFLFKAIQKFDPNVIVLLGGTAVESLLGPVWGGDIGSLERWVGWRIPCQAPHAWICPTYHPSYLLRMEQRVLDLIFSRHLAQAIALSGSKPPLAANYKANVRVELRPDVAAKLIDRIGRTEQPAIAFDYETTALKPETPGGQILTCSMSDQTSTIAFPWHGAAREAAIKVLHGPVPKIAANIKFEDRWTARDTGAGANNWLWDTYLGAHVLDNRPDICSLKFQSFVRLGTPCYGVPEEFIKPRANGINRLQQADLKTVLLYNGMDSAQTFDIAMQQRDELTREDNRYN